MGYINVTWVTTTPAARAMSWGNVVFMISGAKPSQSDNPQLVTPSNYTQYTAAGSYERTAYASYARNLGGTPTNKSYLYWMSVGSGITGIAKKVTTSQYKLELNPFSAIDNVYVDPTGAGNWVEQGEAPAAWASGISGYRAGSGYANIYDGNIYFSGSEAGGPYFTWSGATISGSLARSVMALSGGVMRVLATQNGFGLAQTQLKDYDIQFIVPLYRVAGDGTGLLATPAHNDLRNALGMAAGNRRMVIWALPKAATPNTDYHGTSYDYNQFRNYIGQDQNAIVIMADVLTGANGTGLDDPAAALAGRVCTTHPHTSLTLDTINMSLEKVEDPNAKEAWDNGNIICIFKQTEWGFDATQLNYGFTFSGTTPANRLNNVRCKYIILYNILQDLWRLMSSRTVRINKAGCNRVIEVLHGTLNRLLSQGIIDEGQRIVDIPLLRGTPAEWTDANASRTIPAVIVRWPWKNTVETITITEFGEII